MGDNSVINFGDLTKPATLLVEKICGALSGAVQPLQIVRVARAEAQAELIRAEAGVQIDDLKRRALIRFIEEESERQSNIEEITCKAIPMLDESSDPSQLDDDWVTNFFDKCRITSDDEIQILWARLLSGEANRSGTFSKRTVNLLADFERSDARMFQSLCNFSCDSTPMIFDCSEPYYKENGINFEVLQHLESLGLLKFDWSKGFATRYSTATTTVDYFGTYLELDLKYDGHEEWYLPIGEVCLTRTGEELSRLCPPLEVPGFVDWLCECWAEVGVGSRELSDDFFDEGEQDSLAV